MGCDLCGSDEDLVNCEIEGTSFQDYSQLIKEAREKLGLRQDEFGIQISEKVSIVHKIESGHMTPSIQLAKKLQKLLGLRLDEKNNSSNSVKVDFNNTA